MDDKFFDEAIRSYAAAEPRPGLEERVLHRVRSAGTKPKFAWRWLTIPVAAALLLALFVPRGDEPVPPPAVTVVTPPPPPVAPAAPPPVVVRVKPAPERPRYPKLNTFPAPAPLTDEERALLRLVRTAPELAATLPRDVEPIQIEDIEIQPLSDGGE